VGNYELNLLSGVASLTVEFPEDCQVGQTIEYIIAVTDDTLVERFVNRVRITVAPEQNTTGGPRRPRKEGKKDAEGDDREDLSGLAVPDIHQVYESSWGQHGFDRYSALKPVQEEATAELSTNGQGAAYSYYVNMDNIYLKTELKASKLDPDVLRARWMYALVLVGMSLLRADKADGPRINGQVENDQEQDKSLEDRVSGDCGAIAPVLLPLIESLGAIGDEGLGTLAVS